MNEEKQLEFLDQNIKVDSDFKQFFREERLHEVLANTGEKNVDDFLYCFQPKQITDEIFYEWYSNSNEFLFWAIPGSIFPKLIPLATDLGCVHLFNIEMGNMSSHDFYYLYSANGEQIKKYLIDVFNEEDSNDEIYLFHSTDTEKSNDIKLIDEPCDLYLKSDQCTDLLDEIDNCKVTYKSKFIKELPKTLKALPILLK